MILNIKISSRYENFIFHLEITTTCDDDFTSSTGNTCDDYITYNWCTANGSYGSGWGTCLDVWSGCTKFETFASWKNKETGYNALSCTVCGCKDTGISRQRAKNCSIVKMLSNRTVNYYKITPFL